MPTTRTKITAFGSMLSLLKGNRCYRWPTIKARRPTGTDHNAPQELYSFHTTISQIDYFYPKTTASESESQWASRVTGMLLLMDFLLVLILLYRLCGTAVHSVRYTGAAQAFTTNVVSVLLSRRAEKCEPSLLSPSLWHLFLIFIQGTWLLAMLRVVLSILEKLNRIGKPRSTNR